MSRPNVFVVTSGSAHRANTTTADDDGDDDGGSGMPSRQDSLLPGQIRHPTMQPPTPFLDWARGDSQLWDSLPHGAPTAGSGSGSGMEGGLPAATTGSGGGGAAAAPGYDIWGSNDAALGGVLHPFRQASSLFGDMDGGSAADGDDAGRDAALLLPQALAEAVGSFAASSPGSGGEGCVNARGGAATRLHGGGGDALAAQQQHLRLLHAQQRRDESAQLAAALHRQAEAFPPPPPLVAPMATRRARADLWFFHAAKWDITMRLPPPPRNPLGGMEEEHRLKLQELTKVPYRGDRWLARCEYWHNFVQTTFEYPPGSDVSPVAVQTIYEQCCLE